MIKALPKKGSIRSGGAPEPADILAGERLRTRRKFVGLSQGGLGKAVGVSFQQIQKYENGSNRISISRLKQLASILDVPANYFTDEQINEKTAVYKIGSGFGENAQDALEDMPGTVHEGPREREVAQLVSLYCLIKNAKQRRKVLELIKTMVDG